MRRRAALLALAATLTMAAPAQAATYPSPPAEAETTLPVLAALDGTVVASCYDNDATQGFAAAYRDGATTPVRLTSPDGTAAGSEARAVNDRGDIVGSAGNKAVLWTRTATTDLTPQGATSASALAINSRGDVVIRVNRTFGPLRTAELLFRRGTTTRSITFSITGQLPTPLLTEDGRVYLGVNPGPGFPTTTVWRDGTTTNAKTSTGADLSVSAVSPNGNLAGYVRDWTNTLTPVFTNAGTTRTIPWMTIIGVSDTGAVIGNGQLVDFGPTKALRWQSGTLTDLTPTAQSSFVATINRQGDIAGSASQLPGSEGEQDFVHHNGVLTAVTGIPGHNSYSSHLTLHPTQPKLYGAFQAPDGKVKPYEFTA